MHTHSKAYFREPPQFQDVGTCEIAYRTFGMGEPLLLVHGWPLSGATWRHLLPTLAEKFTCTVVDLPGAGETRWRDGNDFSFSGQAANLERFLEWRNLRPCHVIAHNTGATIAREVAVRTPGRFSSMVLIGTEIPDHRPPWVQFYQQLTGLPGSTFSFQQLMKLHSFVHSSMGLGGVFSDKALLDGDFRSIFLEPLITDSRRMLGQIHYLRGIDWQMVDRLGEEHRRIACPVLLIWGEDDQTFPLERAKILPDQFPDCHGLIAVPRAKLFVQEEQPEAVARHIQAFHSTIGG